MWLFIFKIMLMYNKTKLIKNINASLEKQEGKEFLIKGRLVDIGKITSEERVKEDPVEPIKKDIKKVSRRIETKKPSKKVVKKSTKKKK